MAITPGEGEFWKEYKGQLKKAMDTISDHGVSVFDRKELKRIATPIIREAKKRVRELEHEGLTDSPAYRYLIRENVSFTAAGKNLNSIKHNVKEAFEFLQKKTSTVKGSYEFFEGTVDKWVGFYTSKENREVIWDLYNRLEKIHPGYFLKETYSSAELDADIYTISQTLERNNWDIDRAIATLTGHISGENLTDLEEDAVRRWSGWME